MNTIAHLTLTLAASAATAAVVANVTRDAASPDYPPMLDRVAGGDHVAFDASLDALANRVTALEVGAALPARAATADPAETIDEATLGRVVRQLVERGELGVGDLAAARDPNDTTAAAGVDDPAVALTEPRRGIALLREAGLDTAEARELWTQAEELDVLDDLLDEFAAQAAPNSTEDQFELARAYHAAAIARPSHANGTWWHDSDDAYDRVLELEPGHWQARYNKAVNLTFWPAAYGRMPEAIQHLETLVEQQDAMPIDDQQARTYVWLGNLRAQQGDDEAARSIWKRGLMRHPNHDDLNDKLAAIGR